MVCNAKDNPVFIQTVHRASYIAIHCRHMWILCHHNSEHMLAKWKVTCSLP